MRSGNKVKEEIRRFEKIRWPILAPTIFTQTRTSSNEKIKVCITGNTKFLLYVLDMNYMPF
jgi:hypothetical protein